MQVNAKLDELALEGSAEAGGGEKARRQQATLRWLLLHTSPRQMKWLVDIILKDLKVRSCRAGCWGWPLLCTGVHHPLSWLVGSSCSEQCHQVQRVLTSQPGCPHRGRGGCPGEGERGGGGGSEL